MNNKIVVTVIGKDKTGIVAGVSAKLSELNMNILDIKQNILHDDIFAMVMIVDESENRSVKALQDEFKTLEDSIGVKIFLQHEDIFKTMHRI